MEEKEKCEGLVIVDNEKYFKEAKTKVELVGYYSITIEGDSDPIKNGKYWAPLYKEVE